MLPIDLGGALSHPPGAPPTAPAEVEALAWGAAGTRLALLLGDGGAAAMAAASAVGETCGGAVGGWPGGPPPHPRAGQVALFAVRRDPVISATLIGFVQGPPAPGSGGRAAAAVSVAISEASAARGAPLLTVRWRGGAITLVPLLG